VKLQVDSLALNGICIYNTHIHIHITRESSHENINGVQDGDIYEKPAGVLVIGITITITSSR